MKMSQKLKLGVWSFTPLPLRQLLSCPCVGAWTFVSFQRTTQPCPTYPGANHEINQKSFPNLEPENILFIGCFHCMGDADHMMNPRLQQNDQNPQKKHTKKLQRLWVIQNKTKTHKKKKTHPFAKNDPHKHLTKSRSFFVSRLKDAIFESWQCWWAANAWHKCLHSGWWVQKSQGQPAFGCTKPCK